MPAWPSLAFCGGLGVAGCGLGSIGLGGPPARPTLRYVQAVLSDKPVSYYRLEDLNSALFFDEMGVQSGSSTGTVTYRAAGPLAEGSVGYTFDGATGYAEAAATWDPSGTKPFSIEMWIKPTTVDATFRRACGREPVVNHGALLAWQNALNFYVGRGDVGAVIDTASGPTLPGVGQWYHVVGTYDGALLKLYTNAVPGTAVASARSVDVAASTFRIGGTVAGGTTGAATIDEVAIYSYALTAKQIANHYRLGRRVFLFPDMPELAAPYIAHLYNNGMQFKKTLGSADGVRSLRGKPGLKMTINGGYHPIELDAAAPQPAATMVPDPGFEASNSVADVQNNYVLGAPAEWTLQTGVTDIHSGRRAMKCTTTGTGGWNALTPKIQPNLSLGGSQGLFPVVPGRVYRLSCWSKQNAGVKAAVATHLKVTWFDKNGAGISNFQSFAASGAQPWTYRTGNWTAPPEAVYAQVAFMAGAWDGVTGTDAQTWVDDLRFVDGSHADDPAVLGDIIQLTEQGDPSATVLYTGIVEKIAGATLSLTPLVAELGRSDFNKSYTVLTDVGQMVRDAVNATNHLRVQPETCGDSGVPALANFNTTNVLEVLQQAKRIAGPTFFYFIDATGLVWFQSAPTVISKLTLKRSYEYTIDPLTQPERMIDTLINLVRALGGFAPGSGKNPPQSTYSNAASQLKYGKRALTPLVYPTVYDQSTLDKIVATIGNALDRERTSTEIDLPNYGQRLTLGIPGGLVARLFDTAVDPYPQPTAGGSGAYLGPYVAQDIEVDGVQQKLVLADVAVRSLDELQPILDRMIQAASVLPASF